MSPNPRYKLVELDQKSDAWKQWRATGIGASDAPIILDLSPHMKPHTLWEIKCGLRQGKPFSSFVEERAQNVENAARAYVEMEIGKNYPPVCMEDVERPWMKASLDGFCQELNSLLEAKWVASGKETGLIVAHHWIQLQHQMAVSGCDDAIYVRSNDGVRFFPVIVKRNDDYIAMMIEEEKRFMHAIKLQHPMDNFRRFAGWRDSVNLPMEVIE